MLIVKHKKIACYYNTFIRNFVKCGLSCVLRLAVAMNFVAIRQGREGTENAKTARTLGSV